jgi:hypothetical protein
MDAVGAEAPRQIHVVIDEEGDVALGAQALKRLGEPGRFVLVDALDAELECGDRPGVERLGEPARKIASDVER